MIRTIKPSELKSKLSQGERLQLVDVRSAGEYASGHIPGTINMPLEQVDTRLDDLHTSDPIVIVCQSGKRAGMCYENLKESREDLYVLDGGTSAWMSEGLPTVSSVTNRWSIERQVRLAAGMLVLTGTLLSLFVNAGWIYLAMFVGAGLTFAGLTNICGMAFLFGAMPWNKAKPNTSSKPIHTS